MAEGSIRWIGGKQFVGQDSTRHSVLLSTPDENVGMKPSELLLVSLASCTAVDVVEILQKKRFKLEKLEIKAEAEQDPNPPWAFRKIHLTYTIKADGLTDKDAEQAIERAQFHHFTRHSLRHARVQHRRPICVERGADIGV